VPYIYTCDGLKVLTAGEEVCL